MVSLFRPRWYAALFSCVLHILALGIADRIDVGAVPHTLPPVKVELRFQPAIPLPVSENALAKADAPSLPPTPKPEMKPAVNPVTKPQPRPKPSPVPPPVVMPKPLPKPRPKLVKPPPEIIATPTPSEALPIAPPPEEAWSEPTGTGTEPPQETGRKNGGEGNTGGEQSTQTSTVATSGGGRGTSAQPDYGVNPKPPYPMLARRMGIQGTVILRVHVHADGRVITAEVKQSSGSELLDDAALRTVREQWKFVPGRLNNEPVESWVEVPIRFVLATS